MSVLQISKSWPTASHLYPVVASNPAVVPEMASNIKLNLCGAEPVFAFPHRMNICTAREVHWTLSPSIDWSVEQAWVLALDSQLKVIEFNLISKGTVDSCPIHPRDIFRFVLSKNACSFILAHNHPSGNDLPSAEDIEFTKKIIKLAELHEISFLDHVILTKTKATSLRALKTIRNW